MVDPPDEIITFLLKKCNNYNRNGYYPIIICGKIKLSLK